MKKRLNNKGFTLIELLAVVVILAVVMGIATTSVLSAMNKSRGGSLEDSTAVILNAFNQKYTETLVDGVPSAVYGDVAGFEGFNFAIDSHYYLDSKLASAFNISTAGYSMNTSTTDSDGDSKIDAVTSSLTDITESFVAYDADNGKFFVCMVANPNGNVHVAGFAVGGAQAAKDSEGNAITSTTFDGNTYTFKSGFMFACSDGTRSW